MTTVEPEIYAQGALGVSTRELLEQIARQRGWDPSTYQIAAQELSRMCQLANQALEAAWRFAMWPQLLLSRRVQYRPSWSADAAPYAEGEQCYHRGVYWEALTDAATDEPSDESSQWQDCRAYMICGVSYAAYRIDEMDLAAGVFALDPDRRSDVRALPASRSAFGCVVEKEPGRPFVARPFLRYRPLPPRLSAEPWQSERTYSAGALVYCPSDGETYEATVQCAGVDPATRDDDAAAHEAWLPRRCPRLFETYVVERAAAILATDADGRTAGLQQCERTLQALVNSSFRAVHQPGRAKTRVFR